MASTCSPKYAAHAAAHAAATSARGALPMAHCVALVFAMTLSSLDGGDGGVE